MITWGIVGTGRMAARFARAIEATPGHRIGAVVGRRRESAEARIAELRDAAGAVAVVDPASLPEIDLVYVASPNDRHLEHVVAVVDAGLPVLCEKPLAPNAEAARMIRDEVARRGGRVAVAFQYRQHPAHRRARGLVAAGVIGRLRMVDAGTCLPALDVPPWYADPSVSGGGILPMTGVHRADIVRHVVGRDFESVVALVEHHRGEPYDDTASILGRFADGGTWTMQFGLDAPHGDDRIAFHGTDGSIVLESTMSQWWSPEPGRLTVRTAEGSRVEEFSEVDTYRLQVEAFAEFADGRRSTVATMDDAIALAEFTEAVYASGGHLVPVSSPVA